MIGGQAMREINVGDKILVTMLDDVDVKQTNLKIGSEGIITKMDPENINDEFDLCEVDFGSIFECFYTNPNLVNGSYRMFVNQIKVIS